MAFINHLSILTDLHRFSLDKNDLKLRFIWVINCWNLKNQLSVSFEIRKHTGWLYSRVVKNRTKRWGVINSTYGDGNQTFTVNWRFLDFNHELSDVLFHSKLHPFFIPLTSWWFFPSIPGQKKSWKAFNFFDALVPGDAW